MHSLVDRRPYMAQKAYGSGLRRLLRHQHRVVGRSRISKTREPAKPSTICKISRDFIGSIDSHMPSRHTNHPTLQNPSLASNVWKESEILTGTVKFGPSPDIKNILVTGGSGFIGSWVVRHLVCTYPSYSIVNLDKLDYCSSVNNTAAISSYPNYQFYYGNVANPSDVTSCLRRHKIDTILHFAAQSHVDNSFDDPYCFTYNNVCGTHVMLESARKHDVRRFIHVSTDEVYGEVEADRGDVKEDSVMEPTNPYAASKAAAEMLVKSYLRSFQFPVITVRGNNVFGPHQHLEKIIPKFSCLSHKGEPLSLHGDGSNLRRYLYASDAVDAFDVVLHRGKIGEVYNIASQYELSNLEVAKKILSLSDAHGGIIYTQDRPFNDSRYAVDGEKLKALGWMQKVSFDDGLSKTREWYTRFGDRWWCEEDRLRVTRKGERGPIMSPSPTPSDDGTCTESPQT